MTAQIYIQETATDPNVRARDALRDRAEQVREELEAKVALATQLRLQPAQGEQAREGLIEFCAQRLVRYLLAIDRTLHAAAAGAAETRLLVRALRVQHDLIGAQIDEVCRAEGSERLLVASHALLGLVRADQYVEREVLVPALAELPGVDLPGLVTDLDTLLAGGVLDVPEILDVREIPHGQRHPRIFGLYARLAPGESFILVNNHDPKPLRREFEATYPGQYSWTYLESGPQRWQVQIGRLADPTAART